MPIQSPSIEPDERLFDSNFNPESLLYAAPFR